MIQKKICQIKNKEIELRNTLTEESEPQPGSGFLSGWY